MLSKWIFLIRMTIHQELKAWCLTLLAAAVKPDRSTGDLSNPRMTQVRKTDPLSQILKMGSKLSISHALYPVHVASRTPTLRAAKLLFL